MKKLLVNIVFLLCFFPFFKLLPFVRSEIQPYAGIFAIVLLLFWRVKKDNISFLSVLLVMIICVYGCFSVFRGIAFVQVLLLATGYMFPVFIFLVLKDNFHYLSKKILFVSIILYAFVGILQQFRLLVWTEPFMSLVISHFKGGPFGGGRGVLFLASEPSYAAVIIFFMFATAVFFYHTHKITKKELFFLFTVIFIMLLINKSASGVILFLLYLLFYYSAILFYGSAFKKTLFFFMMFLFVILLPLVTNIFVQYTSSARYIYILSIVLKNIGNIPNLFSLETLSMIGGKRFLTVIVGYMSIADFYGLGHGVSSYLFDFSRLRSLFSMEFYGFSTMQDYERIAEVFKPDSYGAQIAMDTGIIGLLILFVFLFVVWQNRIKIKSSIVSKSVFAFYLVALYMILFNSSTSLPVPWVIFAYVYYFKKNYKSFESREAKKLND